MISLQIHNSNTTFNMTRGGMSNFRWFIHKLTLPTSSHTTKTFDSAKNDKLVDYFQHNWKKFNWSWELWTEFWKTLNWSWELWTGLGKNFQIKTLKTVTHSSHKSLFKSNHQEETKLLCELSPGRKLYVLSQKCGATCQSNFGKKFQAPHLLWVTTVLGV